jgi:prepilin-type N-terminal cleavage/methylation domain-containing protein
MHKKGFTIVELLVALMVGSIILAAVATLAYALGKVNDASNDTSQKQMQVRSATLRISEMIRHSKLICSTNGGDIVIWKADDNPANNKIDVLELAYIETTGNRIRIMEFSGCQDAFKTTFRNLADQINTLGQSTCKSWIMGFSSVVYTPLIPNCSNVQILTDAAPPLTKSISISFNLQENKAARRYQINTTLRCWAGYLLDTSNKIVNDDD